MRKILRHPRHATVQYKTFSFKMRWKTWKLSERWRLTQNIQNWSINFLSLKPTEYIDSMGFLIHILLQVLRQLGVNFFRIFFLLLLKRYKLCSILGELSFNEKSQSLLLLSLRLLWSSAKSFENYFLLFLVIPPREPQMSICPSCLK